MLFSSLLPSSLELSDATIYEPCIRALLVTASHLCEAVVLRLRVMLLLLTPLQLTPQRLQLTHPLTTHLLTTRQSRRRRSLQR